jgi:hypothetical protein
LLDLGGGNALTINGIADAGDIHDVPCPNRKAGKGQRWFPKRQNLSNPTFKSVLNKGHRHA